jgi:hypothetical protein
MVDYEQLGIFYLGKKYDLDKQKCLADELVLYESRDLLTHAVCVGMTGSGKTGLCIDLLEEAAIDNIPVIALDLKGDLSNLLLTFEDLSVSSFAPWVDADEARRARITTEELAAGEAQKWQKGLNDWHQDATRIKRLKESAEFVLYTPASSAGIPLSVVGSFNCPDEQILAERDLLREQISLTATSILALLGIDSDPLKAREHILLSSILDACWKAGENLDLPGLIEKIQNPPVKQLGAVPLESFFPRRERYELAMSVNNLAASPGFEAWLEGEPLNLDHLFYAGSGRNKVSIISIAHLSDSERMFFVSLLLTQLLSWMRRQSGTSSLRAIFYMDEIAGYFPPVANPPSKGPLLTLLKQARAFGLGLVLATQNPVDLDYKALGNTGTWFIGRLQTERDKMRVLDGLEGAASDSGQSFNRAGFDRLISGLSRQVFLMNNVHQAEPVIFKTRWSLSYLRGPLSRAQLKTLKAGLSERAVAPAPGSGGTAGQAVAVAQAAISEKGAAGLPHQAARPMLGPEIVQRFVAVGRAVPADARLVYKPMLFACARLHFTDSKANCDYTQVINLLTLIKPEAVPVKWEKAFSLNFSADALLEAPAAGIEFADLPPEASEPANYKQWLKDFSAWIVSERKLELFRCPVSGQYSNPQESERDFRIRLQQAAREKRDALLAELSGKYSGKLGALQEKLSRAQNNLSEELAEARSLEMESAVNVGASLFEAFVGRKVLSSRNIRRAESAARKVGKAGRQRQEVAEATEAVEALQEKIAFIQAEFASEMSALKAKLNPQTQTLDSLKISLKKANVSVGQFCLAWTPCIRQTDGKITAAW